MYKDPRSEAPNDCHEVLTEDSDDALADLEKEFAVRKQKLMEERACKRERSRNSLQVQRSPSPKRVKEFAKHKVSENLRIPQKEKQAPVKQSNTPAAQPRRAFQRVASTTDQFAVRLFESEKQNLNVDYNERFFEFENIPEWTSVALNEENTKDSISGVTLRRRCIEERHVTRLLKHAKILRVSKLLAKVHPPQYEEPTYTNWCFAGTIIYKSDPKWAVNGKQYMTFRVGDFNHTVDVFLFGDAFQKFWKLSCGDVIVILNPTIKKYGGGFSLSLHDGIDNVLEIGALKFYGRCSATNKQGEQCKFVIDLLKNELCSFHEESRFRRGSRMELQGSVKPKAPTNKQGNTSQAFVSGSTNQPLFIQYENAGLQEKDIVYNGGEQFNEAKYDRPVKESEAAKLRKRKANEKLRMQLLSSAPPSRLNDLDKLGIVQQKELEIIERQNSLLKVRLYAFKNKFLTGMGYDFTYERSRRLHKVQPTKSMEELRSISKTKKVSLRPSVEEQQKKRQRQETAMCIIKSRRTGESCTAELVGSRQSLLTKSPLRSPPKIQDSLEEERAMSACENEGVKSADSDTDLEISFACDADKLQYNSVISGPVTEVSGGEGARARMKTSQVAQI